MRTKCLMFALAVLSACAPVFAVESAVVIIKTTDGKIENRTVKAEKIGENTNRIVVPIKSLPENTEYVDVLADNAVAKKGEKGFWIAPRGETGSFKLDNGLMEFKRGYTGQLYMPIYGMQTPRETFVSIIKGLGLENDLIAEAKNGEYKFFPRWNMKFSPWYSKTGTFKPYEDIVIDYITLKDDDANYSGMARAYRKYQLDRGVVTPFKERMTNNPALRQIATAMPHRIEPHCIIPGGDKKQDFTPQTVPPVKAVLTFADAKKFVDAFKAAGMTDVHFVDAGWQCGGYDGKCPQILPIEECVGGEAALRDFVKYTQSLGYQICANSNHTDAYAGSDMWNPDYVAKKPDGTMYRLGPMKGGYAYYVCVKRAWELFIKKQLEQTRALGYEGVVYIDVFSAIPPLPCYDKNHPVNRKEQAQYQNEALAYAKKLFGGAASECGYDHCIQNLDFVNYLGRRMLNGEGIKRDKDGKLLVYNEMLDRVAPLWELVYHGIVLSNPDKFTQGYLPEGSTARLRLVEFGGRPIRYSASYSPANIAQYKEMYEMFQPLKHLQVEFIEENRELAQNVFLTRYGNGEEVVVNYSDKPFSYKGQAVAARDYRLYAPLTENK